MFRFLAAPAQEGRSSKASPQAKQPQSMSLLIKHPFNPCDRWWKGFAAIGSTCYLHKKGYNSPKLSWSVCQIESSWYKEEILRDVGKAGIREGWWKIWWNDLYDEGSWAPDYARATPVGANFGWELTNSILLKILWYSYEIVKKVCSLLCYKNFRKIPWIPYDVIFRGWEIYCTIRFVSPVTCNRGIGKTGVL